MGQVQRPTVAVERREGTSQPFSFKNELNSLNSENCMQRLSEMNERIYEQGMIVARRADIMELKRYKEMVADFMNEPVRFAYEFKKESTLDARGRHRIYALIKKINKRLTELTEEMLREQKDNLTIMQAIDDINGMLLDMLV